MVTGNYFTKWPTHVHDSTEEHEVKGNLIQNFTQESHKRTEPKENHLEWRKNYID